MVKGRKAGLQVISSSRFDAKSCLLATHFASLHVGGSERHENVDTTCNIFHRVHSSTPFRAIALALLSIENRDRL